MLGPPRADRGRPVTEHPSDYAWTKRMRRFTEVSRIPEAKCWSMAADADPPVHDIHEWLEWAEKTLLTKAQKAELAKWNAQ